MTRLTPEQAADRLGIADEHFDTFVRLVDALRTPDARTAEVERLRAELDAVNAALHEGGVDYPQGAAGVRDLVALRADQGHVGEYRMSTRERTDEPADDGEFVEDYTSGKDE